MEILGLSGYARSGKDEAAKVLVDEFGFTRVAFADKLREMLYALNPLLGFENHDHFSPIFVQDAINEYAWSGYKDTEYGDEIRRLLQRLGTEAGRQTMWDDIWVDAAFSTMTRNGKYVITDARYPNEAQAIRDAGGQIWRIERLGVGPANGHASEVGLDDWKFNITIHNDGTLEEFKDKVRTRI